MARNKSEKSPFGDPMVDHYLRSWLRWQRLIRARDFSLNDASPWFEAGRVQEKALLALSTSQRHLLSKKNLNGLADVERLYGHEAEFQDGTQSK